MRKVFVAVCALGAAAGFVPASATARTIGYTCGFIVNEVPRSHHTNVGEIDGGPLVVVDADGIPLTATLICSIHLTPNYTYADPAVVTVTSLTTTGVVVVPPTPVSFEATQSDIAVLCTQLDIVGGPTYYNAPDGSWSTDPATECAFPVGPGGPEFGKVVKDKTCPVLAIVLPPEGDGLIFDCPPT